MLRSLVALLALANLLFWAWTQGWLTGLLGVDPQGDREPQRMAAQIEPDGIRLLKPGSLAAAARRRTCLEAGPFSAGELPRIEALARNSLPEGAWTLVRREKPGSWFIYMGRYPAPGAMQRKTEELKRLNVAFEELKFFPSLEPGFSFGRYGNLEDAQAALKRLTAQRVRTARIVQITPPQVTHAVRIPRADAEVQATAAGLGPQLSGKSFSACREPL